MPLAREINHGIQAVQAQAQQAAEHSGEWAGGGGSRRLGAAVAHVRGLLLHGVHLWCSLSRASPNPLITPQNSGCTCTRCLTPAPSLPARCAAAELRAAQAELSRLSNLVVSFQQAVCQLLPTGMPGPHA